MTDNFNQDMELQATSGSDDEFDGLDIAPSNPGKKRQTILIAVLALLIVGGGGFFAYTLFLGGDEFTPGDAPAPLPVAEAPPVPAPTDVAATPAPVDPNAPVTDPAALPADVTATPPLPPTAPDAVAAVDAATGVQTTDTTAPTAPAETAPATVDETIEAVTEPAPAVVPAEVVTPAATADAAAAVPAPVAVPAPSDQQLQPIDPNAPAAPTDAATAPVDKNAATAEAVKEILGTDAAGTPTAAQEVLAKQVEVTPHIKQVIVVHKTYSSKSSQAINAAGDRVLAAGQYGDAVTIYDQQLKQNPSDPIALAGKANALQKSGRDADALAVYQRLLDLNPRDLEALTNYLGILQKQKPEEALSRLTALDAQYPDNAAVAGQLAMTQATLMDTPAALKAFQKAIALDPTNPIYPFNMGVLLDRLGTTDRARDAYRHAIELTRQYPEKANQVPADIIRQRLTALSN